MIGVLVRLLAAELQECSALIILMSPADPDFHREAVPSPFADEDIPRTKPANHIVTNVEPRGTMWQISVTKFASEAPISGLSRVSGTFRPTAAL